MVKAEHTDYARAVIASALLLQRNSATGTAAFRRDVDQSRKAIQASRELLKRLRLRYRDDMAHLISGDADPRPLVSAFDADILRSVFRTLVRETGVPECQWRELAKTLVHEFTGCERVEDCLADWIIHA